MPQSCTFTANLFGRIDRINNLYNIERMKKRYRFLWGFVKIAEGLFKVITLGMIKQKGWSWSYRFIKWAMFKSQK